MTIIIIIIIKVTCQEGDGDVKLFNADTERNVMHATMFSSPSKALCLSSLAAVGLLYHNYQLRDFTNYLLRSMTKGHNGFTHSQWTSLQSKEGGTLYTHKNKTMVRSTRFFFVFF